MPMNAETKRNRFEAELDQRARALDNWRESEWVVDCLRSKSGASLKELGEEEIVEWHRTINHQP